MANSILSNGTLLSLGLVGVVAAVGAANKAGLYGSRSHRGKTTDLIHADLLDELGRYDSIEVIGSVQHPPKRMSEDATHVVLLHLPEGWSVLLFDDEGLRYTVEYANVPSEAMARAMAHNLYGTYNHHAMRFDWKEMKKWAAYRA